MSMYWSYISANESKCSAVVHTDLRLLASYLINVYDN